MINDQPEQKGDPASRKKAMALVWSILASLLIVFFLAGSFRYRLAHTSVEVDLTSWTWAHGSYGVEGFAQARTFEYWEVGPLLISVPQR